MSESLEEKTKVPKDIPSAIITGITALAFLADGCYTLYSGSTTGTPKSMIKELGLIEEITWAPYIINFVIFGTMTYLNLK